MHDARRNATVIASSELTAIVMTARDLREITDGDAERRGADRRGDRRALGGARRSRVLSAGRR